MERELIEAIQEENIQRFETALGQFQFKNLDFTATERGESPLMLAVRIGNIYFVERLLKSGADPSFEIHQLNSFNSLINIRYDEDNNIISESDIKTIEIYNLLNLYEFNDEDKLYILYEYIDHRDFEMVKMLIKNDLDIIRILNISESQYILFNMKNINFFKFLRDKGFVPQPALLEINRITETVFNTKRYQSGRPVIDLPFITNTCRQGFYLPVYRIDKISHLLHNENENNENNRKQYGTYYYYEPESSSYLNLGKVLIFANKVDAFMKLSKLYYNAKKLLNSIPKRSAEYYRFIKK